jgi:hypothetical protein
LSGNASSPEAPRELQAFHRPKTLKITTNNAKKRILDMKTELDLCFYGVNIIKISSHKPKRVGEETFGF